VLRYDVQHHASSKAQVAKYGAYWTVFTRNEQATPANSSSPVILFIIAVVVELLWEDVVTALRSGERSYLKSSVLSSTDHHCNPHHHHVRMKYAPFIASISGECPSRRHVSGCRRFEAWGRESVQNAPKVQIGQIRRGERWRCKAIVRHMP